MMRLVLLPGMHGTGELFSAFMSLMPETKQIEALCYPNDAIWSSYSLLLRAVQAWVPESDEYYLLAESFSTPLAIQFAATRPANLKGLILCAGFASSPMKGWRRFLMSLFAPFGFNLGVPRFGMSLLIGPHAPPALLAAVRGAISAVSRKVLAARARAVLACDARGELSQIDVPILYLLAKQDRIVPASCLDEILRIRPDVKVVSIDAPHLLLQREPQQAATAVADFIGQIESAH
jgi:pimeloyl-[acyl-carrier protein] methyl ester esterase